MQRQADAYSPEELGAILEKYGIKATATGNDLTKPFAFNLMFGTKIGPSGALTGSYALKQHRAYLSTSSGY